MHDRTIYTSEHDLFRASVRRFFKEEVESNISQWEADGIVPRAFWRKAGDQGFLCCGVPDEFGGPGADFFYNIILSEEAGYGIGASSLGIFMQSDIIAYYMLNHASSELKAKWLPPMVTGEVISALGMTEPGCGSDLKALKTTAVRDGDSYVINGQKTFITNGQNCDFILLACKTDRSKGTKGISLILVEADRVGFVRGRNLDKIGQKSADTSELFFTDVRVPVENLIGRRGMRLCHHDGGTGPRAADHRIAGARRESARVGADAGLCQATLGIRPIYLRFPEYPVHPRRHSYQPRRWLGLP